MVDWLICLDERVVDGYESCFHELTAIIHVSYDVRDAFYVS